VWDFFWSFYTLKYLRTCFGLFCVLYFWSGTVGCQWLSSSCVVPGPGASKFCLRRRKLSSSFLHVIGRLLCSSTRMGNSTISQTVFGMCRRLHWYLSSRPAQDFQCCTNIDFLYFPSSPTRTFRSLFTLLSPFADKIKKSVTASPFFPIHSAVVMTEIYGPGVHGTVCNEQQYQQSLQSQDSRSPSISCLTHGDIIGLVVSIQLICLRL
jgi:hypothetical protein